jgi:CRP-like cAMP-binding protein
MVSPELLRRYPFFSLLNDSQLKAIAMIAEEESIPSGATILEEGEPAEYFYLLLEGSVDLFYTIKADYHPEQRREVPVGVINPGEPFGISALIEPHVLTSTTRSAADCKVINVEALALRRLLENDPGMSCILIRQVAKSAIERLNATRVQLAAALA